MHSSQSKQADLLDAFNQGDMARVLSLSETHSSDDETCLLLRALALRASNRLHEALPLLTRLTQLQPHTFEYWNNLGLAAREAGDMETAAQSLQRALALAPQHADVHYNLGLLHLQQKNWLAARDSLLEAVRLEPNFVEARLQAAHACHVCGDNTGEEAMLENAANWPPQPVEQALTLAGMLSTLGRPDVALRALEQAQLPQDDTACLMRQRITALRAALYERANRLDLAQAELTQLPLDELPAEHAQLSCAAWLAHAAVATRHGDTQRAAELYERALTASDDAEVLAQAAFGLASARDKQARHHAAWQALRHAHETQLSIARTIVPELMAENSQPLKMADLCVSRVEHDRWAPLKSPRSEQSPVFVLGFPRSGTTLLEQMLDAHPDFCAMDERAFLHELTERMGLAGQAYPAALADLTNVEADQLRTVYADLVRKVVPDLGTRRLVDKNPLNMLCLPMIMRLFPEARIILCLRHPCDVLMSCYMQSFRSPAFMVLCSSLQRLAHGYVRAFEHWFSQAEVFAPRVLEWRYESVVNRFDEQVLRLGHYLQLDDPAPLARYAEHARNKTYISTPSYAEVTQGIHSRAVHRWHAYREQFELVLPILRPMMERLGYT
ncbi:tetratricopeptide repeat-containing sulfotransferase family protein [Dyella flagellata]|uniref:tetratricopeptide repeat-containing sulfotransferase family protein n=1 Tax=Dyella flagellata TaxID=1867833 RepID=UPI0024E0C451|nr:tetratricopeptide repeat-containing sulfotransferase family protein [Dyella flagellata]